MARVVQQARAFTHKTTYASDFNPNTTERVKRVVPPASNPKASSRRTICLRDTAWWQYPCGRQELLFSHGLGQGVGPARTYNATLNSLSYADPRFVAACGLAGRSLAIPVHSFLFVARLPGKPQVDTVLWCGSKHNDFTGIRFVWLYALSPRPAAICRVSAVPVDVAPSMQKLADARTRWEADRNHVPNQTTNSVLHDQKPYLWTKQTSGTFGEYTQACPAPSRNARRSLLT